MAHRDGGKEKRTRASEPVRRDPRRRSPGVSELSRQASLRLRRFRQGTAVAVAATGLLLMLLGGAEVGSQEVGSPEEAAAALAAETVGQGGPEMDTAASDPGRAVEEAAGTLRRLVRDAWAILPKIAIALAIIALAAVVARLLRAALRRALGSWVRAEAASALGAVLLWIVALGVALSVLAGDVRALVGSIGLFGLALSWALQAPIESFTGWMLNSFRGYYRLGDRILVGEVFGDVFRIDFLTTTVWEAGGPDKPVQGAQPTGALVTFPNSEILRSSVVNYSRDLPYVWDEVTVGLAPETDLRYAIEVLRAVADRVVGEAMAGAAERYAGVLKASGLPDEAARRPEAYLSPSEAWTNLTLRYLVPVRERRIWLSRLTLAVSEAAEAPENEGRIVPAMPRYVVAPLPPSAKGP